MHAYLLVGTNSEEIKNKIEELAKKLKTRILEFPLVKIEDVRNLNSFLTLSISEPTIITIYSIHEATHETLNAFLKNLEEPQSDLYFALSAPSIGKVLPTIVSRCQIIKVKNSDLAISNEEEFKEFLEMTLGKKLIYIDRIKERKEALDFAENLINFMHSQLHGSKVKYTELGSKIEVAQKCLTGLRANGNVNLHLSKMAINI